MKSGVLYPGLHRRDWRPLPEVPNGYRAAAVDHLQLMYAVDEYLSESKTPDSRPSLSASPLVGRAPTALPCPRLPQQLGIGTPAIIRACAKFREMAGLDSKWPTSARCRVVERQQAGGAVRCFSGLRKLSGPTVGESLQVEYFPLIA
jgi:hypothetical protein